MHTGTAMVAAASKNQCGGYKATDGSGMFADAVIIPSLDDDQTPAVTLQWSNLCGQSWLAIATNSVCSKKYHTIYSLF